MQEVSQWFACIIAVNPYVVCHSSPNVRVGSHSCMLKVLVRSHRKGWCHGYLDWVRMTLQGQVEWGGMLPMFVFIQTTHSLLGKGLTVVTVACASCTARCCASKIRLRKIWAICSLPSLGSWLIFLRRIAHLAGSFFCEIFVGDEHKAMFPLLFKPPQVYCPSSVFSTH